MIDVIGGGLLIIGLLVVDGLAQPSSTPGRRWRSWQGTGVLLGTAAFLLGVFLYLTGAWTPSIVLVLALAGVLTLVSNIKRQVLGESLVFSDFALVGAVFQHPHFYLSALRPWQFVTLAIGVLLLFGIIVRFSTHDVSLRFVGIGVAIVGALSLWGMLRHSWWAILAQEPDLERDVRDHGLIATLVVYWHLWSRLSDLAECPFPPIRSGTQQLVVVVQCESFADPVELFGPMEEPLPGLTEARALSWRSGRLVVSGFGAYTMRTEFGALFGVSERTLGLRRFDPFLTAASASSWALPRRLAEYDWSRVFVHPHDLRFYGRDKVMPAAGFDTLVGEDEFPAATDAEGRYVSDAALCDKLIEISAAADRSAFIYAVTIENHGPWSADDGTGSEGNKAGYLRLLMRGDALLTRLMAELPKLCRPTVLCFFGDHRPSIPLLSVPGGDRHTPYVIVRFDEKGIPIAAQDPSKDLTPAELHSEILTAIGSGR